MGSELKPCPFCGGTDVRDTGAPGHWSVQCACHRGGFETQLAARECWNTRQEVKPSGASGAQKIAPARTESVDISLTVLSVMIREMCDEHTVKCWETVRDYIIDIENRLNSKGSCAPERTESQPSQSAEECVREIQKAWHVHLLTPGYAETAVTIVQSYADSQKPKPCASVEEAVHIIMEDYAQGWVDNCGWTPSQNKEAATIIQSLIDKAVSEARQAQHEATWKMAIKAAKNYAEGYADSAKYHGYVDSSSHHKALEQGAREVAHGIRRIPCPPINGGAK